MSERRETAGESIEPDPRKADQGEEGVGRSAP